jgi:hypothetical protein
LNDLERLENKGRPTYLLNVSEPFDSLPDALKEYILFGEKNKLHSRALVSSRKPWYKTEKRDAPELLFAYLGRRNSRFILNTAGVVPLHCLHCVYLRSPHRADKIHAVLNHPSVLENLKYVAKSYGSGALKVEPQSLARPEIPVEIAESLHVNAPNSLLF